MQRTKIGLAAAAAISAVFVAGCVVGGAVAAQPHMQAALDSLISARAELIAATPNKAGHRAKAIQLVDSAIAETREGIRAGG